MSGCAMCRQGQKLSFSHLCHSCWMIVYRRNLAAGLVVAPGKDAA